MLCRPDVYHYVAVKRRIFYAKAAGSILNLNPSLIGSDAAPNGQKNFHIGFVGFPLAFCLVQQLPEPKFSIHLAIGITVQVFKSFDSADSDPADLAELTVKVIGIGLLD
jgi:hypothetical protein